MHRFLHEWQNKPLREVVAAWLPPRTPSSEPQPTEPVPDDAVPVCPRCHVPQEHNGWFCPACGAAVGPYNNTMPFLYVFSVGEVLRAGVDPRHRWPRWITAGLVLVSFSNFILLWPLYLVRLFRTRARARRAAPVPHRGD